MDKNKIINIHGTDKEVKWVEIDHDDESVAIFFNDFTYVKVENVKIKIVE